MLILIALVLFFFTIPVCFLIVNSNPYFFYNNYYNYKQSNIINKKNINLGEKYIKYFNQLSGDNLLCFSGNTKVDNNCYFRGYYGFIPPKTKLNIGNFILEKESKFIFSGTNKLELILKNNNIQNIYDFNTTGETRSFKLGYYNLYVFNKNNTWEQFFITTKSSEGIKKMPFYSLTYNCNCYDSGDNLKKTDQLNNCEYITGCNDTGDYITTGTIYSGKVLLKANLNIYNNDTKQFKKLFYFSGN